MVDNQALEPLSIYEILYKWNRAVRTYVAGIEVVKAVRNNVKIHCHGSEAHPQLYIHNVADHYNLLTRNFLFYAIT